MPDLNTHHGGQTGGHFLGTKQGENGPEAGTLPMPSGDPKDPQATTKTEGNRARIR